ncbi:MAG: dihydroorotate dehydrogenase (quinone), partial [Allomuricauda sp.]
MYKLLIRPLLFLLDAETAHHFSFSAIKTLTRLGFAPLFRKIWMIKDPKLEREVFGLKFMNPVGLAAGFDKDARLYNELSNFGFGFVEIG